MRNFWIYKLITHPPPFPSTSVRLTHLTLDSNIPGSKHGNDLPTEPGSVGDVLTIAAVSGNGRTFTLAWTTPSGATNEVAGDNATAPTTEELIRELQKKTEELERTQEMLRTALERMERQAE